jgi:hypothetical protein
MLRIASTLSQQGEREEVPAMTNGKQPNPIIQEQEQWLQKTLNFPATPATACCVVSTFSPTR